MKEPTISVIMSVYNTPESWLRASINSILAQTFNDYEFIIILDKPTDGSDIIVKEYCKLDSRIRCIENETNIGLTKSLNKGLREARGVFVARMDSDDISLPNRFALQYTYMKSHQNCVALGGKVCCFGDRFFIEGRNYNNQEQFRVKMLFGNVGIPHPTAFIRKEILDKKNIRYNEEIKKSQDYQLWVDLMPFGEISELDEVVLFYRIHSNQISYESRVVEASKKDYVRVNMQKCYALEISAKQLEPIIGPLSDTEREFLMTINDIEIPGNDNNSYGAFLDKITMGYIKTDPAKGKLVRKEINLIWCYKAIRQMRYMHNFSMMLNIRFFSVLSHYVLKEILFGYISAKRNGRMAKKLERDYRELIGE